MSTRLVEGLRATRATMTTTARIGSSSRGLDTFHDTPSSSIPSATALVATAGRSVSRPSISAASARSSTPSVSAEPTGRPRMPARRNRATNASAAASAHTSTCSRWTGIPRVAARSARSALARMAVPARVRRRNSASATITTGATTRAMRSLADRMIGSIVNVKSTGAAMRVATGRSPHRSGSSSAPAASSCDSPIVATVSTSRGALAKRRITTTCTTAPSTERGGQAGDDAQQVADAGDRHERHGDHRGDGAEVGLGEVDDAARPVGQRHPERQQGGQAADDDPPHDDARRGREHDQLQEHDGGRRGVRRQPLGPLAPGRSGARHASPMPLCTTRTPLSCAPHLRAGRHRQRSTA